MYFSFNNLIRQIFNSLNFSAKVPVSPDVFEQLKQRREISKWLIPSKVFPQKLWRELHTVLVPPTIPESSTESTWFALWDAVITNPLIYWEGNIERHRYTCKLSDTGRKRPDNVPLYHNKALFHGEEKALNTPGNPKDELVSKLDDPWPYKGKLFIILN